MTDSDRIQRLKDGVGTLRVPGAAGDRDSQLLKAGIAAIAAGIVLVVLGWWGASGTLDLSEHVPYLISGGVLGLCLVVAGTGLLVRSAMARLLKLSLARLLHEQQTQTNRSVEVLERLEALLGGSVPEPPMMAAPSTVEGSPAPTNGHDVGPGHDDQPPRDTGSGSDHEHSHAHVHDHGGHVVHAHDHEHAHRHDEAGHAGASDGHPHAHGAEDHDHDHAGAAVGTRTAPYGDEPADDGGAWMPPAGDDGASPAPWPPAPLTEEPDTEPEPASGGAKKRRQPLRARKPSE